MQNDKGETQRRSEENGAEKIFMAVEDPVWRRICFRRAGLERRYLAWIVTTDITPTHQDLRGYSSDKRKYYTHPVHILQSIEGKEGVEREDKEVCDGAPKSVYVNLYNVPFCGEEGNFCK